MRNKENDKIKNAEYHQKHKDEIKERKRLWYLANKEKIKAKNKVWREANKEHLNDYQVKYSSEQYKNNPTYKLKTRLRKAIKESLKRNGYNKTTKTATILGCSFEEFKQHIEAQFESWMNWDNHGLYNNTPNYGWDIDHIIPIATAKTEDDIIRLNHYTNLRPLCSYINRVVKRDNI
jgi:hypothetical protein